MFFSSPVVWPMFGIWLRHGRRPCCREPWPIRCPLIVTPVLLIACLLLMPFIYYQSLGLLSSLPCRLAFVVRSLAFDRRLLKNVFRLQKCLLALKCLFQLLFNFWHFGLQKKTSRRTSLCLVWLNSLLGILMLSNLRLGWIAHGVPPPLGSKFWTGALVFGNITPPSQGYLQ